MADSYAIAKSLVILSIKSQGWLRNASIDFLNVYFATLKERFARLETVTSNRAVNLVAYVGSNLFRM